VRIENAFGANGNDTLIGNEFINTLLGGNGNDTLDGQLGTDTLGGGAGNDSFMLGSEATGTDIVNDASGRDTIFTMITRSLGSYTGIEDMILQGTGNINGTGDNNFNGILGNDGANILAGMGGNDALEGRGGADFIFGQAGQDSIIGGLGNDTHVYQTGTDSVAGPNCDYVRDFDDGNDDRIDLQGVFAGTLAYRGTAAFIGVPGEVRIDDVAGPNVVVAVNLDVDLVPEMQILLLGTVAGDMAAGDFLL
jgi:Ca2+-binding RTX toxin-like protein